MLSAIQFRNTLGTYWHVVTVGIQNTLVYRVNFLFRALFQLIPLLATIYLWRAIYGGKTLDSSVGPYSLAGMTSYYVLVTLVDAITAVTEDDWQIAEDIREGHINQFLLKPIDYLWYRLCLFFSGRLIYSAVAALPLSVFIFCLRQYFVVPPSWWQFGLFLVSVFLTALIQFFLSYTMALLAFWVLEVSTFIFILFAIEYIAGGHLFPLDILPPLLAKALSLTPFPYELYFPISIYLGHATGRALWFGLGMQIFWVVGFYLLARFIWSRGVRVYTAFGG